MREIWKNGRGEVSLGVRKIVEMWGKAEKQGVFVREGKSLAYERGDRGAMVRSCT